MGHIETIARYVDGTLQDRVVHARDVEFSRVPNSGRDVSGGWACDFAVLMHGQRTQITVSVTEADAHLSASTPSVGSMGR